MRKAIFIFLLIMIITASYLPAFAESGGPIEMPDVNFVIDGSPIMLSDVTLGLNGRTMLPLRAVLASLGVPDDDEHIEWNDEYNSVTVRHNGRIVYLRVDDKTAFINGKAVELDAVPFIYAKNNRVYIPVRFVAKALGREAAWDKFTKTVYIRNEVEYTENEALLEGIEKAMESVVKAKADMEMIISIESQSEETGFNVIIRDELDRSEGILHSEITIPILDKFIKFNSYYLNNAEYTNSSADENWRRTKMEEKEFKKLLENETSLLFINNMDVLAAALYETEGSNPDEILLTGNVYPKGLVENLAVYSHINRIDAEEYYIEISADRTSGLLKSIFIEISGEFESGNGISRIHAEITGGFTEIGGDFKIVLPEEINSLPADAT